MSSLLKTVGGGVGLIGLVGAVSAAQASLFNVDGGYRAVKFSRIHGVIDKVYNEGTHFLVPLLEQAILYDVRAKPRNIPSLTGTKGINSKICNCHTAIVSLFRFANGQHNVASAGKAGHWQTS